MTSTSVFNKDLYKGKVVFVTGGGTGICYDITKSLMQHGCNAAIFGRRENVITESAARLSRETGAQCIGVSGDVRKLETLEAAVKRTVEKFGKIDYVVCGAAGNFLSPLEGLSANAFRTVMEIDTIGTYNTYKATIGEICKSRGVYLAISATLHYKGQALQAHVSAAKAGVDALFRVMAVEYGPRGVRTVVIAPGPIDGTEGLSRLLPQDVRDKAVKNVPVQRFGSGQDIANAALFLFSPAASYISGTCLVVDGADYHTSAQTTLFPYPDMFLEGAPKFKL
ncbi:SDR family oxidoreductase [Sporobolomyces koalae]|uniref:SDR family oxidoreductase n=1 Tax=Sporobolomyces koalae TaxID=500713 RepID=UPI00316DD166